MAMVSRDGPRFGATCNWARFSTQPASANAPSMNTGRPSRPTTIPRARLRNAGATCKSLTSGKKEAEHFASVETFPHHREQGRRGKPRLYQKDCYAGLSPRNLRLDPVKSLAALLAVAVQ